MALDWGNIEEQYSGNGDFKDWAAPGKYTVKCDGVEFKAAGAKGNYVMKFHFADTDVQFPTADHWLVKDKQNWRAFHAKNLYQALGADEDRAKKACELAESKDSFDFAVQAYEKGFSTLLNKQPEIEIEVWQDGKYTRADFTNRKVRMSYPEESESDSADSIVEESEEVNLDIADLPF